MKKKKEMKKKVFSEIVTHIRVLDYNIKLYYLDDTTHFLSVHVIQMLQR